MEDDSSGCEKDKVRGSTQETEGAVNCVWMESWEATAHTTTSNSETNLKKTGKWQKALTLHLT